MKEYESFSGKKKINSYRMLSVCDHKGRYIYVRVCLGRNDHKVFTSSPLYLQEGNYFSEDEFVALDGGFEGDGRFRCSYNTPGNHPDRVLFNLVFHEICTGVENAYSHALMLALGFLCWETIRRSYHIQRKFCFWQSMLLPDCTTGS